MTQMKVKQLLAAIPNKPPQAENALSLTFQAGQMWGILGPNGVGKTTLLHTLASLKTPASGTIELNRQAIHQWHRLKWAQHVGLMFQDHQDGFPATVLETVLLGRFPHLSPWERESEQDLMLAYAALARLDLTDFAQRPLSSLSGGERQRAALATLLVQDPEVWLVDEPSNHLDLHYQVTVMGLLAEQAQQGRVVVTSLHDVNIAAQWCSHVLLMYPDKPPVWGTASDLLTQSHLEPLYRQKLAMTRLNGKPLFVPVA